MFEVIGMFETVLCGFSLIIGFIFILWLVFLPCWAFFKWASEKKDDINSKRKIEQEIVLDKKHRELRNSLELYEYDCNEKGEELFFHDIDFIDDDNEK